MRAVLKSVAAYAAAAGLCLLLLVWVMQLWRADWKVPFQYGFDALWMQSWVKGLLEGGWYLHNGHLGAPFGQDLHDFPLVDTVCAQCSDGVRGGYAGGEVCSVRPGSAH